MHLILQFYLKNDAFNVSILVPPPFLPVGLTFGWLVDVIISQQYVYGCCSGILNQIYEIEKIVVHPLAVRMVK